MQKYSISQNEKQLVKALRGLVYHVAKVQKNKWLDFNLLQNQHPTIVYGVVYAINAVETQNLVPLQLVLSPKIRRAVALLRAVGPVFVFWNQQSGFEQRREHIPAETRAALVACFFHHFQDALWYFAKLQNDAGILFFAFAQGGTACTDVFQR